MEKILLDELSNIISAYKEGKALQFYTSYGEFKDVSAEEFDIEKWYKKPKKFRIKPEPKYRPFKNAEECLKEMSKHTPFGWLKGINRDIWTQISYVRNEGIETVNSGSSSYESLFDCFIFFDGKPFGVKVEE